MAINEYMQPVRDTFQQDYVSQYVPLPFEQMQKAVNIKQKQYDDTVAMADAMKNQLMKVKARPGIEGQAGVDEIARDEIISSYENRLNEIAENVGGDYSKATEAVRGLAQEAHADLTRGTLGRINQEALKYEDYVKRGQEADIRDNVVYGNLQKNKQDYETAGGALNNASAGNLQWSEDIADFTEVLRPLAKDIKAKLKAGSTKATPDSGIPGHYMVIDGKHTWLTEEDIINTLTYAARGNQKLQASMQQALRGGIEDNVALQDAMTGLGMAFDQDDKESKSRFFDDPDYKGRAERMQKYADNNTFVESTASTVAKKSVNTAITTYKTNSEQLEHLEKKILDNTATDQQKAEYINLKNANNINKTIINKSVETYKVSDEGKKEYAKTIKELQDVMGISKKQAELMLNSDQVFKVPETGIIDDINIFLTDYHNDMEQVGAGGTNPLKGLIGLTVSGTEAQEIANKKRKVNQILTDYKNNISDYAEENAESYQPGYIHLSGEDSNEKILNRHDYSNYTTQSGTNLQTAIVENENISKYFDEDGTPKGGLKVEWETLQPTNNDGTSFMKANVKITGKLDDEPVNAAKSFLVLDNTLSGGDIGNREDNMAVMVDIIKGKSQANKTMGAEKTLTTLVSQGSLNTLRSTEKVLREAFNRPDIILNYRDMENSLTLSKGEPARSLRKSLNIPYIPLPAYMEAYDGTTGKTKGVTSATYADIIVERVVRDGKEQMQYSIVPLVNGEVPMTRNKNNVAEYDRLATADNLADLMGVYSSTHVYPNIFGDLKRNDDVNKSVGISIDKYYRRNE